jgi:mRNA interferase MazF
VTARGEVWLARLDPTEGREIQKTRPCVVISPHEIHDYLDVVIVAPMTTGSRAAGFRVEVKLNGKPNRILLDQIRTIDKSRLLRKVGALEDGVLSATLAILRKMFAD